MKRRALLVKGLAFGVAPLAIACSTSPTAVDRAPRVGRVGLLTAASESELKSDRFVNLRLGLREEGWTEPENLAIVRFEATGIDDHARKLVAVPVDVVIAFNIIGVQAAKAASTAVPIVMAGVPDPVEYGLVESLSRPGGQVTGVALSDWRLIGKRLELLREVFPRLSRIALLWDPERPASVIARPAADMAADAFGVALRAIEVRSLNPLKPGDEERALDVAASFGADAILITGLGANPDQQARLVALASARGLPIVGADRNWAIVGAVLCYGYSVGAMWHRAGRYGGKILSGATPSVMPIESPTSVELIVNLKAARALGVVVAPLLTRATEVIE